MVRLYSDNGHFNGHLNGDGNGHHVNGNGKPPFHIPQGKTEHSDRELRARAFNLGSDARIRGDSLWDDPYAGGILTQFWRQGWHDVDQHWGAWAKGPVMVLPEVRV